MDYFGIINRAERILGRPVTNSFSGLTNEFQENIKSLVKQVNKDVLMAFTYPCRERETTLAIEAEEDEDYSSVINTISGEINCVYNTDDEGYYKYNKNKADFILGHAKANDYGFRNNEMLFCADDEARTLTIEYYTNKLALDDTAYEDFVEGTTVEKDSLTLTSDYSILPSFLHESILAYGACYYFEAQKNESRKVVTFKGLFEAGIRQLNAHNRAEEQEYELEMGNLKHDLRRSAL